MEKEEGGGEGEPARDGRGVIQRRWRRRGFWGGLKGRFKEKLWSRIRTGWKKRRRKRGFEGCLRRRAAEAR